MRIDIEHTEDGPPHWFITARGPTGEAIGHVKFRPLYECACIGIVYGLAVREDSQRKGIGSELIARVEKLAVERGISLLLATVREANAPSRALCEKLGFRIVARCINPRTANALLIYSRSIGGL